MFTGRKVGGFCQICYTLFLLTPSAICHFLNPIAATQNGSFLTIIEEVLARETDLHYLEKTYKKVYFLVEPLR